MIASQPLSIQEPNTAHHACLRAQVHGHVGIPAKEAAKLLLMAPNPLLAHHQMRQANVGSSSRCDLQGVAVQQVMKGVSRQTQYKQREVELASYVRRGSGSVFIWLT